MKFSEGPEVKLTFIPITLFVSIIVAPIVEELLFRGYLLNKWGERLGAKKSIFLTSFLFAVLHIGSTFIVQFVFGILCCLVYMKTKNLLVPIVLHMLNNCISRVGAYIIESKNKGSLANIDVQTVMEQTKIMGFIGLAVSIILLPLLIMLLCRLYQKTDKQVPYLSNT
ncbi:MAG: CPBP family intramembrane glutamic endopeptidase [Bacillus sp. (in: firmicutes)]